MLQCAESAAGRICLLRRPSVSSPEVNLSGARWLEESSGTIVEPAACTLSVNRGSEASGGRTTAVAWRLPRDPMPLLSLISRRACTWSAVPIGTVSGTGSKAFIRACSVRHVWCALVARVDAGGLPAD
eukprot:4755382-Prymnesium_polylepis.1